MGSLIYLRKSTDKREYFPWNNMASDKQKMFVQVVAVSHSNISWLWLFVYYFFCESPPWCLAAWHEVCAPATCWPVGWEDRAALWGHRETGIMLWGEIRMVPSCGGHAATLGQCWVCAPGRRGASNRLGAALGEAETSSQHAQSVAEILFQMSMRAKMLRVVFSWSPRPWL